MAELNDAWVNFERQVINPKASPAQRVDMRDAFYAGAVAIIEILSRSLDPDSTAAALQSELAVFGDDVARRAAAARKAVQS